MQVQKIRFTYNGETSVLTPLSALQYVEFLEKSSELYQDAQPDDGISPAVRDARNMAGHIQACAWIIAKAMGAEDITRTAQQLVTGWSYRHLMKCHRFLMEISDTSDKEDEDENGSESAEAKPHGSTDPVK